MKNYLKVLFFIILTISIILIGCPTNSSSGSSGGGGGSSDGGGSETPTVTVEDPITETGDTGTGTGTVTGTINDDAKVTLEQSDGSTQETNTTQENPDFIFENVPEGETTVIVETDDGTTNQIVQVNEGETTQVNPFGSTQQMENSLCAKVYEVIDKGWLTKISDMTDIQLGNEFYAKEINVPERSFSEGFPGITDRFEWFGIVYEGQITAPVDGTYTFIIQCDDGAVLWINNVKVVDGDGVHPTKTYQGSIDLVAGQTYSFLLKYFQGPRYHITLVLKNQIPGQDIKLFNSNDFAE